VILLGIALAVVGALIMAWSRRLSRVDVEGEEHPTYGSLTVFVGGCTVVAIGAILVADWFAT
jgi:drug/metabolite transporter (DMT)-like permease